MYVLTMTPVLIATQWRAISGFSWMLMLASALLALNLSYWIWYTGLQHLGGSRTSIYSSSLLFLGKIELGSCGGVV